MRCLSRSMKALRGGEVLVIEGPYPRDGQPAEMNAEKDHEEKGKPEGRHGKADENQHGGHLVEQGVLAHRRENSDGYGDDDDEAEGENVDEKRNRQSLQYLVGHGPVIGREGLPEIKDGKLSDPGKILLVDGLVQIVKRSQPLFRLRRSAGIHLGLKIRG